MNRKTKTLLASYGAAAVFTAAGLIFTSAAGVEGYRISQDIEYRRALAQLVSSVSRMDEALEKGRYAEGSGMTGKICAELMSAARSATTALSILPLETYALEELGEFLAQLEEYARVKGDLACSGKGYSAADRQMSGQLQAVTGELVPVLGALYTQVSDGGLSIRGLLQAKGAVTEEADTYLEDEILALLENFPDTPRLIYAGSLSDDHYDGYAALAGLENVTETVAQAAADALVDGAAELSLMGTSYGELPCWYFTGENESGAITVSVTRKGGLPVLYLQEYTPGEETVSTREAEAAAEAFLQRAGYGGLKLYDSRDEDGLLKLRYVYDDGTASHPDDGVELSVALDTPLVVAMDAADFLRSHESDSSTKLPPLTAEEVAASAVPEGLEILEEELTWFTRDTGTSVLCRRFLCQDGEGRQCTIYADAETGSQVEIKPNA